MKKISCYFTKHDIKYVDYRDTKLLQKFLNPHGKILSRRSTGLCAKYQRALTAAVKRSRFMAFLPYIDP